MMEVSTRACSSASRATLSRSPWADGGSSYGAQGFVLRAARPVCHNKGSRTVAAVRLPGFRDGLSYPSGCSAGMQSPRSAVAVSLPLLQRSGLSASHPDQSASVDANVGLVPTQSPPLIGINSPAGVLLARGRCRGGTTIVAPPTLMSCRVRQRCHKLPFRGPLLRAPLGGDHTGWHERTNDCHPSHVRVDSCPNVQLTPTSAIP